MARTLHPTAVIPGLEPLVSDANRDGDLTKPAQRWTQLPVSEREEAAVVARLLEYHERYHDDLPLMRASPRDPGFYNSNSYVHSLLIHRPTCRMMSGSLCRHRRDGRRVIPLS